MVQPGGVWVSSLPIVPGVDVSLFSEDRMQAAVLDRRRDGIGRLAHKWN